MISWGTATDGKPCARQWAQRIAWASSVGPVAKHHDAHEMRHRSGRSDAAATACTTSGASLSAASTASSSMRMPRTFTWWSLRPGEPVQAVVVDRHEVARAVPVRPVGAGHEAALGEVGASSSTPPSAWGPTRGARPAHRAAPVEPTSSTTKQVDARPRPPDRDVGADRIRGRRDGGALVDLGRAVHVLDAGAGERAARAQPDRPACRARRRT